MEKGAILIGKNVVGTSRVTGITGVGTWSDIDRLVSSQLEPAASVADGIDIGLDITLSPQIGFGIWAVALLGTNLGGINGQNLRILANGQPTDYETYWLSSPGSPAHLVIVLPGGGVPATLGLRWNSPQPVQVGSLLIGRVLRDVTLADSGLSMRYIDSAGQEVSPGGQVYPEESAVMRRRLILRQGSMEQAVAFGLPQHGDLLDLPAPTVNGVGGSVDGNRLIVQSLGSAAQAFFTWPSVDMDGIFRVDYRYLSTSVGGSAEFLDSPLTFSALGSQGTEFLLRDGASNPLRLQITVFTAGRVEVEILAISRVGDPGSFGSFIDTDSNFVELVALSGKTKPIIFMPYPSDPVRNRVTGIYGHVSQDATIDEAQGAAIYRSAITIDEAR